jgi:hypothetical protein
MPATNTFGVLPTPASNASSVIHVIHGRYLPLNTASANVANCASSIATVRPSSAGSSSSRPRPASSGWLADSASLYGLSLSTSDAAPEAADARDE